MCGIFGVRNINKQPIDTYEIEEAAACLNHRGPDDSGMFLNKEGTTCLAHRRLSIIDTSYLAHQPMTTDDGRFTIVLNGEIYNYLELSDELKSKGHRLKSHSDTEVLLKLFQIHREYCLSMLRGMFAFVVWDEKEKAIFAARDRFGIKPFYYSLDSSSFLFASELKAVKKYRKQLCVSHKALYSFLRNGSVEQPLTIYENVYSLMPGHFLILAQNAKLKIERYWWFGDCIKQELEVQKSNTKLVYDDEAKEKIRSALLSSIKAHCVSDVEVGAFLSGGIDSSAIISLSRLVKRENLKTISVTFPGNSLDESNYSSIIAKRFQTNHFEYQLTEDEVINDLEKFFSVMDQPTIDGLNTYFVSKAAKSIGLKVVLSGLGGDELFGGYPSFKYIPQINSWLKAGRYVPFNKKLMLLTAKFAAGKIPSKGIEFLKNPYSQDASYRLFRGLFSDDEIAQLGFNHRNPELVEGHSQLSEAFSPLQHVSYLESTNYMANQLLADSDTFSMTHSLELRVPFVDHLLYASVLPYLDSSYDAAFPKRMLVEAVGDLPDEIVHRPKMGFTFPFADWMKNGRLKNAVREMLLNRNSKLPFNRNTIEKMFADFENSKVHWSRIWAICIAKLY